MRIIFTLSFLLLSLNVIKTLQAQSLYKNKNEFINSQAKSYEKWLKNNNLSEVVKVHSVQFDTAANKCQLWLTFSKEDQDSSYAVWKNTKNTFEKYYSEKLEKKIFNYWAFLTEMPEESLEVSIFDVISNTKPVCYSVKITSENYKLLLDSTSCKNQEKEITIKLPKISIKENIISIQKKEEISKMIYDYCKKYFLKNGGIIDINDQDSSIVKFNVINLRREVLTDESNPNLAKLLNSIGLKLDWAKREKLYFTFTITYQPGNLLKILINIDGKYGSGIWKPKENEYGYLPMEPEFKEYLEKYINNFKFKLKNFLIKK